MMRGTGMHSEGRSFTGMVLARKDERIRELEEGIRELRSIWESDDPHVDLGPLFSKLLGEDK
jgi:hypothetical protein